MDRTSLRLAIGYSLLQRYGQTVLSLLSLVILARLLTPADYGVFAVGLSIITFMKILGNFGTTDFLISCSDLTNKQKSSAFSLSLIITALCSSIIFLFLMILPKRTLDQELLGVLFILNTAFLIQPFSITSIALLSRNMKFKTLCAIGLIQTFTRVSTAIVLAAFGFGVVALSAGYLASEIACISAIIYFGIRIPRPGLRGFREVVKFGWIRTVIGGLYLAGEMGTRLAISYILGFGALGSLDRSLRVTGLYERIVFSAINPLILPAISEKLRNRASIKREFLYKISFSAVVAWPFFGFLFVFAAPIVRIILGTEWIETIPIVRVLSFAGLLYPFHHANAKFLIALDMMPTLMRRQLIVQPVCVFITIPLAFVSIEAAAVTFIFSGALRAIADFRPLSRRLGFTLGSIFVNCLKSFVITILALLPSLLLVGGGGFPLSTDIIDLLSFSIITASLWAASLWIVDHPLARELSSVVSGGWRRLKHYGDGMKSVS